MMIMITRSRSNANAEDSIDDNGDDEEEEEIRDEIEAPQEAIEEEEENRYYAPLENEGNNIFTFYFKFACCSRYLNRYFYQIFRILLFCLCRRNIKICK